jgi:hypothetical protein
LVICFIFAFPLIAIGCLVVWLGLVVRIRAAFSRHEQGEGVLTPAQLGNLNLLSAAIAAAGGMIGVVPFVVLSWMLVQEPYLDSYVWLVLVPPGLSAALGGVLMAAGLLAFAAHFGRIGEMRAEI